MSAFTFRWYGAQTLKMRLFPEAHSRESCPGFLFLMLEASVHWSIEAEIFSAEHSLGLSCEQVFTFWFSNLILLFFWSDYQVPWWFIFPTLLCFDFSELISVFASMSTSLSGFQHLHKPYPILLLSGFWHLASAYFYELHFPSCVVSGIQLKLVGSHLQSTVTWVLCASMLILLF